MQLSKEGNKAELMRLWQDIFHDSDEFVKLFFDGFYRPENAFIIKRNNLIISALHILPYKIKINEALIPAVYICGVCTVPSERGNGLMRELMVAAKDEIIKRGYGASLLIPQEPWLFDVYKKLGYTVPIRRRVVTCMYSAHPVRHKIRPTLPEDFTYFDRKQKKRNRTILHDEKAFNLIIKDLRNDGGNVWTAVENDTPVGITFVDRGILFRELHAKNDDVKQALINFVLEEQTQTQTRMQKQTQTQAKAKANEQAKEAKIHLPCSSDDDKSEIFGLAMNLKNLDLTGLYAPLMIE
ncbi:MAG: GNAT family N-acetyltransferase [Tannerella sp.]|jgi:predicted acetyltransferase|nr:GNAT family N-acetyltransferase [Tannerella sp.]